MNVGSWSRSSNRDVGLWWRRGRGARRRLTRRDSVLAAREAWRLGRAASEREARQHRQPAHVLLAVHLGDALLPDRVRHRRIAHLDAEAHGAGEVIDAEGAVARDLGRAEGLDETGHVALFPVRRRTQTDGDVGREVRILAEPVADDAVHGDEPDLERMAEPEDLAARVGHEHALTRALELAAVRFDEEGLPETQPDEAADGAPSRRAVEDGLRRLRRVRHVGIPAFDADGPIDGGGGTGAGEHAAGREDREDAGGCGHRWDSPRRIISRPKG